MRWHVKITKSRFSIKLIIFALSIFFCVKGYTNQLLLESFDSLSNTTLIDKENHVIVPYSIFSNVKYTHGLNTFRFSKYEIKIDSIENIKKILVRISKINPNLNSSDAITGNKFKIEHQLPWWSKSAPTKLKQINFSNVDGALDFYNLNDGYQLSLLQKQGNWGKVYLLEHLSGGNKVKICAVKLILTRSDRSFSMAEFQERHITEIRNNLIISNLNLAIKPYGIIKNDDNHYLLFMEYGNPAHEHFKKLSPEEVVKQISKFIIDVEKMHASGFTHGDLKVDNMLIIGNIIKLCDWLSLNEYNKTNVGEFRYIGDNLPPEAIRANYFNDDRTLKYSVVGSKLNQKVYILHPISSDRFCMAVSLLEILEPDLYKKISYIPKGFNPWAPESLEFYPHYVNLIKETQTILLERANISKDLKRRNLYKQISQFIDVDPMKRIMLFNSEKQQ